LNFKDQREKSFTRNSGRVKELNAENPVPINPFKKKKEEVEEDKRNKKEEEEEKEK
jgi:hypothetical protein